MALRRDTNGVRHGREKAMRTTSPLTAPASSATILEHPIEVHQRPNGGYTRFAETV